MPLYEFECQDCKERFEQLTGMEIQPGSISCPVCQGNRLRRLISSFGFKGSKGYVSAGSSSCGSCSSSHCGSCS